MSSLRTAVLAGVAGLVLASGGTVRAQVKVDPELPPYKPVPGVSGSLKSVGSDSMNNLMTFWSEGFQKHYPNVRVEIEGKGSGTAPPALIAGTAQFGPMSRAWKASEIDEFEKKYFYKPIVLPTSIDMLAVYVGKDNPVKGLTLQQLDAVFSQTRKLGAPADVVTWGQLGLTGDLAQTRISLYGRNAASGTYAFFKEKVLGSGDYKDSVKEQAGSSGVVQGVAGDRAGIGYSGIGYLTADVRAVPLFDEKSNAFVAPSAENADKYPLSRPLLLSVNFKPGKDSQLDPLRREFLRYVYSQDGQQAVVKDGYLPISAKVARAALARVNIKADF
jgi:phosphate transport system substrate-binding protein